MNIDLLLSEISCKYNINIKELNEIKNNLLNKDKKINLSNNEKPNIILPFCNYIYQNRCKAIVYNHGLFTQCNNKDYNICKKCNKKLLYGRIEDRIKYSKNNFVTINGKKEIPYEDFIKKQNYNITDVKNALFLEGLTYEFTNNNNNSNIKKSRGRPKKNINTEQVDNTLKEENDIEENEIEVNDIEKNDIEVQIINIDNVMYYMTNEKVLLNKETKEIVGLYDGSKIIREL